ncbi:MAG TPA: GNAT family N-acetyltransferase [Caulobacteraceae bacterium]|nr:GNAT family N-acetyltransferase [Caulobacteraceae bacterium]
MRIALDDPARPEVAALLEAHLELMRSSSPPESVHALPIAALRAAEISFWTAWEGEALLGCGALKALGAGEGEIKSMHTAEAHRGRGVAAALLAHLIAEAKKRGWRRLMLETGSQDVFAPSRALYRRFGFSDRGPFADYWDDPNSVYMELAL